ncbi:TTN-1 protein, partial [Aphelenchoides avenae]
EELKFVKELEDISTVEGTSQVIFSCDLSSDKDILVTWKKDGRRISTAGRRKYTGKIDGTRQSLTISDITKDDAGRYECVVLRHGTSVKTEANLVVKDKTVEKKAEADVKVDEDKTDRKKKAKKEEPADEPEKAEPPKFHLELTDQSVKVGSSVTLTVTSSTIPETPAVEWFKNGEPVASGARYRIREETGGRFELVIRNAELSDDAQWKAVGRSRGGTCTTECHLTVLAAPTAVEESSTLDTAEPADEKKKPKKTPGIVEKRKKKATTEEPEPKDTGDVPVFHHKLVDTSINPGDRAVLTVTCSTLPQPDVEWFRDGKPVTHAGNYRLRKDAGRYELEILSASAEDQGRWMARGTNAFGTCESECQLSIETRAKPKDDEKKAVEDAEKVKKPEKKAKKKVESPPSEKSGEAPQFHHKLSDVSVKERDSLVLSVTCTTLPEPEVEWYRNDERIRHGENSYVLRKDKGRYELEILSVSAQDEAQWKAVGKNEFGSCESQCRVKVAKSDDNRAPEFTMELHDVTAAAQAMLVLEAALFSVAPATVTWYKDGVSLKHSSDVRIIDDGRSQSLSILEAKRSDAGKYECRAKNKFGEARTQCTVTIKGPKEKVKEEDESRAPAIRMPLPAMRDLPENAEVTLVCAVTGVPSPKIEWLKDDQPVDFADRTTFDDGVASLIIYKAKPTHSGVYACVASNAHGSVKSSGVLHIQPSEEKLEQAPHFKELLNNSSVIAHSELILECQVVGKPLPTVTWYKDGLKMIMSNRMLQYTDRKGVVRLNVMNVSTEDAGEYSCEAQNTAGRDITHCSVKVTDEGTSSGIKGRDRSVSKDRLEKTMAPVITRPLGDAKIHEGNRELIELEVQAFPEPTIEWYHNGQLVAESRTLRTYFDGRVAFLKIYEAHKEHEGEYECRITNRHGSASSKAKVTIESANASEDYFSNMPTFSQRLENVSVPNEGVPVVLRCKTSGQPEPEVTWLLNGKAIQPSSDVRMKDEKDEHSLEITKFTAKWAGTYNAVANNVYGDAHSSCEVTLASKDGAGEPAEKKKRLKKKVSIEPSDGEKPTFHTKLQDKTVVEGETAVLRCKATSATESQITWSKDGEHIVSTRRRNVKFGADGECSLTIAGCATDDAGTYTCTAKNGAGSESTECFLTVAAVTGSDKHLVVSAGNAEHAQEQPEFTRKPPEELTVGEGSRIELFAKAKGEPTPNVRWLKDGREIVKGTKAYETRVTGNGEHVLLIECAVLKSSGTFTCIAENGAGSISCDTVVHVVKQ